MSSEDNILDSILLELMCHAQDKDSNAIRDLWNYIIHSFEATNIEPYLPIFP